AELAILHASLEGGEEGAWLNSRSTKSGVVDLLREDDGTFKTVRKTLPDFVSSQLDLLYKGAAIVRGAPDLVIWHSRTQRIRLIEVKCPNWDHPSPDQLRFIEVAKKDGIPTAIVEWEFSN